jgi:hypothetical protein
MKTIGIIFLIVCSHTIFSQAKLTLMSKQEIAVQEKSILVLISNKDEFDNIYSSLYLKTNSFLDLIGSIGVGNGFLKLNKNNEIPLSKEVFSKKVATEYWFEIGDKSSTYGAKSLIIIWFDGVNWQFTKAPFDRYKLIKNSDGTKSIQDMSHKNGKKVKFINGELTIK